MKFEDWLHETENYSLRLERLYEDLNDYQGDNIEIVLGWLKASWQVGYDHAMGNLLDDGK